MLTYCRGDPARVQPPRPPRQHLQGAHQDPGEGAGVEEFARQVEAEWEATQGLAVGHHRRANSRASRRTSRRPPIAELCRRRCRSTSQALADSRVLREVGRAQRAPASRSRAMPRSRCRSRRPACRPGDATADQMDFIADLADRYSFGELRVSHEQNLILADVRKTRPVRALAGGQGAGARHAEHRPAHQHRLLPGRRLLLARQRQVDPDRAKPSSAASTTSTTCTTSASSTSTSPAA